MYWSSRFTMGFRGFLFIAMMISLGQAADHPCYDPHHLIGWLNSHQNKNVALMCRQEVSDELVTTKAFAFYKEGLHSCIPRSFFTNTKFDSLGRPIGRGYCNYQTVNSDSSHSLDQKSFCININADVKSISGSFVKGYPEGKVRVQFSNGDFLEGRSVHGVIHGKTRIYGPNNKLKFVGTYINGYPSGWCWIFSNDFKTSGMIYVYFDEKGVLQKDKIIYLNSSFQGGHLGSLENDTVLVIKEDVQLISSEEENCVQQLQFSVSEKTRKFLILPVIIRDIDSVMGLFLRSNNIYMFNRVAKTGSQSITQLLVALKPESGVDVQIDKRPVEFLMESYDAVKNFLSIIDRETKPTVFVRHYNFVDFTKYGYSWTPIYINMVRDPIERVISWFYYQRASWNIVERIQTFPQEPLPDSKYLRKDFPSCVLDPNDDECNFIEGTSNVDYPDHRSQMMAFCGHELYCADFNSKAVLQKAKENVERFYPVVGVIEALNESLTVFENQFPNLFPGAVELYHSNQGIKDKRIINNLKPVIPSEIIDILNRNFTRELEFYDFCKQRLARQYEAIKLILK
ncbi:uncharacterized protein [Lepeophtheirus salmonis]|uniref:uncharacterized protein n=1 Tax=Lepeophtheirus salmonis TaxID=72036 RepID=UPI001AE16982|nr:uncharacterized protein LOC121128882 [Lepeophtheirus salmonis]